MTEDWQPPIQITEAIRRQIHETADMEMEYGLMRAYHAVLTNSDERQEFLYWLQRNDLFFATVLNHVSNAVGDVCDEEIHKAITIVLVRECRRLMHERKGGAK